MKFAVAGADKKTGDERIVIVSASSPMEAEDDARRMGLLVSSVTPRTETVDYTAKAAPHITPEMIASIPPATPDYLAIKALAFLFRLNAAVGYILGAGAVVVGIAYLIASRGKPSSFDGGIDPIVWGVAVLFEAIISHGIGEFFLAFRDLVRNSFR